LGECIDGKCAPAPTILIDESGKEIAALPFTIE
jgi:hypothetical protein